MIYLCPPEIAQNRALQENLRGFFRDRGCPSRLSFEASSLYDASRIEQQLRTLAAGCEGDCAIDITGGTDAALFAAGAFCAQTKTPVFTYSHNQKRFYNIQFAPFAEQLPCTLSYTVRDFFAMAGGTLREGRVDNGVLRNYLALYDPLFRVFLQYREEWVSAVVYFQRASQKQPAEDPLRVDSPWTLKGEHGARVSANPELLRALQDIGCLRELQLAEDEQVSFRFADAQVRAWLRDMGSVLELYMYKACLDAACFDDVVSSAVVDWDGADGQARVCNEIDVVAGRGIVPLFISCKICEVRTEALNELAILRDRFGGKGAKAAIVTTEPCNAAARHRAAQLGIAVMDLEELASGKAAARLQVIMKVRDALE